MDVTNMNEGVAAETGRSPRAPTIVEQVAELEEENALLFDDVEYWKREALEAIKVRRERDTSISGPTAGGLCGLFFFIGLVIGLFAW